MLFCALFPTPCHDLDSLYRHSHIDSITYYMWNHNMWKRFHFLAKGPSQCEYLSKEIVYAAHWEDYLVTRYRMGWISKELEEGQLNRNKNEETTEMIQVSICHVLGPLMLYINWLNVLNHPIGNSHFTGEKTEAKGG